MISANTKTRKNAKLKQLHKNEIYPKTNMEI